MSYEALMGMIQGASNMEVNANNQASNLLFQSMKDTRDFFTNLRDKAWQKGMAERQQAETERHTAAVEGFQGRQVGVAEGGLQLEGRKWDEGATQRDATLGLTTAQTKGIGANTAATEQDTQFKAAAQPFTLDTLKANAQKAAIDADYAAPVAEANIRHMDRAGQASLISAGAAARSAATHAAELDLKKPLYQAQGELAQQEVANQKSLQGMVDKEFQRRGEIWKVQANAATQQGLPAPPPPSRQDAMDDVLSSTHSKDGQPALFKGGIQVGSKPMQYKVNSNGQAGAAQGFVPLEYEDNPEYAPQVFFPGMGWVKNPAAAQGASEVKPGFKIPGNPNANKSRSMFSTLGQGVRLAGQNPVLHPLATGQALGGKIAQGVDEGIQGTRSALDQFLQGLQGQ